MDNELLQAIAQQEKYRDALWAKPRVNETYQSQLDSLLPGFNIAIKKAENNPKNFGVLSQEVSSPKEANKVLNESIENGFWRWLQAGRPVPLVDFIQMRWAPIGAENDPKNLNMNWAPNVRSFLKKLYGPEQYEKMKKDKIVLKDTNTELA